MALDFPPGTPGATYTGPNGTTWSWDGAKWLAGTTANAYAPIASPAFSGNPTAPTPPVGDADTSLATTQFVSDAVATSLHDVGRNYIHNSMFNIAQRGAGPFTAFGTTTLDRWLLSGVTDVANTSQGALGDGGRAEIGDEEAGFFWLNNFTGNAAAGAYHRLDQRIENVRRLAGKTVTVSFWARYTAGTPKIGININQNFGTGGSPSAGGAVLATGNTVTLSSTWTRYSSTIAIPSVAGKTLGTNIGTDFSALSIWFSSGATNNAAAGNIGVQSGTVNLYGVQLELGTVATPLEKLDPVTQLQQAQRFYQTGQIVSYGYTLAGMTINQTLLFPVVMRGGSVTVTPGAPAVSANLTTPTIAALGVIGVYFIGTGTTASSYGYNNTFTASADL